MSRCGASSTVSSTRASTSTRPGMRVLRARVPPGASQNHPCDGLCVNRAPMPRERAYLLIIIETILLSALCFDSSSPYPWGTRLPPRAPPPAVVTTLTRRRNSGLPCVDRAELRLAVLCGLVVRGEMRARDDRVRALCLHQRSPRSCLPCPCCS
jgi:hypothetical protein